MIQKLIARIQETGAPIVVGLDPQMKFIPQALLEDAKREHHENLFGEDELETAAEAVWRFNREIIDAVHDLVPAVKPQIAMYEQLGIPGIAAFWKTVRYCHEKQLIVIGDVKRGDIGSTSAAYAQAHLGRVNLDGMDLSIFGEDFCTVNPYLGSDGVRPFVDVCNAQDKGIFVLVKTSNPSSGEFQDVKTADGRPLYELVGEKVNEWGRDSMDGNYSNVGAVVGATYPEQGAALRKQMPHAYILVPGYGAQGGRGKDLVHFFNEDGLGAIVNSSRGIIAAYTQDAYRHFGPDRFAEAARAAVIDMKEDIAGALRGR
jgi:orotidine-5'-phosphate decarboxylase